MEPISQIGYFVGCSADRKVDVYGEPAYVHVYILASFTADEVEFFTNRQDVSGSATYTWDDRDLSAYVPAGSQGAFFNMQGGTSYSNPTGVRKKGSTQDVTAILYSFTGVAVGVDVDRHVEYYRRTTNSKLFLMGYVKQGHGVFKTNPTAISPASGSYQDVDLFYDAPEGAKGVVLR